jgi:DNA-binding MarR family transcriptional regulator
MQASSAAQEAWGHFWQIFMADKPRRLAVMSELGLSFQQSMALMQLEPGAPLPMGELAVAMQCDNSNVTGIVDRLEAAGIAERRPAPHDRRVKTVVLTEHGEAVQAEVRHRAGQPPPELAALSAEDAEALRDILARALASAEVSSPR